MSVGSMIRNRLVDSPDSLAERFRANRWAQFADTFPDLAELHVVDLGGTVSSWARAPMRPRHVTVLTLEPEGADAFDWIDAHRVDACALPAEFADLRADLVYSNAVIEHVGGAERRQRFADTVHRLGDRLWVQTPYRYFPVEPHWLFPGFQFLPVATRVAIGRRWKLVHTPNGDYDSMLESVLSVELVGLTEFRHLFPGAEIRQERVAGLTKSIIAVRS
ncbi:class I SAM-dependent methyltransferase [Nocardioides sp. JQ2195]|uniref:class I SAM-dependent methyltransferase n=1 Tax=Nocardioides sp. JQ2195 TaxID=2592334 RepID=UPI00143E174F|nr:class I SAM-dependent methyltransferase [Nocardioides sp. JQ2195]QIX27851.1 class I SAM-dependent methyltransferase [Nocardioides sp. JQ2195]